MSDNGFKSLLRTVESVLTVVVNASLTLVLAAYFLLWTGLGVRHALAGELVPAVISVGVFVVPLALILIRRRMKASYLARKAAEADVDLEVGSPSP